MERERASSRFQAVWHGPGYDGGGEHGEDSRGNHIKYVFLIFQRLPDYITYFGPARNKACNLFVADGKLTSENTKEWLYHLDASVVMICLAKLEDLLTHISMGYRYQQTMCR